MIGDGTPDLLLMDWTRISSMVDKCESNAKRQLTKVPGVFPPAWRYSEYESRFEMGGSSPESLHCIDIRFPPCNESPAAGEVI